VTDGNIRIVGIDTGIHCIILNPALTDRILSAAQNEVVSAKYKNHKQSSRFFTSFRMTNQQVGYDVFSLYYDLISIIIL
jgi:hypothetical protein